MRSLPDPTGKNKRRVILHIGEYHADKGPVVIQTLLGSCVSVCLYDPVKKIGGMNHILMPETANFNEFNTPARYGIHAMEVLINAIMKRGGDRHQLIAKVFGGAHTLNAIPQENGIGRKNIEFALRFLKTESIRVINKDVGGHKSRKIFFHLDTGDVFLKRGSAVEQNSLFKSEQKECVEKKTCPRFGDITLFQTLLKPKK